MTTRHLAKVVTKAREALGEDSFNAVAIGFESAVDTPDAMQFFATKQGIDDSSWHLLSINIDDLSLLIQDLGFNYVPTSQGFDHIIQATIIDAEGILYRQVYGQTFETQLLVEPLKDLVLGRPKSTQSFVDQLVSKVRFYCTTYDPTRDGYFFDYSLFIGMIIGGLIIILGVIFIVKESLLNRMVSRRLPPSN